MLATTCDLLKSVPVLAAFIQAFYQQGCIDLRSKYESSSNQNLVSHDIKEFSPVALINGMIFHIILNQTVDSVMSALFTTKTLHFMDKKNQSVLSIIIEPTQVKIKDYTDSEIMKQNYESIKEITVTVNSSNWEIYINKAFLGYVGNNGEYSEITLIKENLISAEFYTYDPMLWIQDSSYNDKNNNLHRKIDVLCYTAYIVGYPVKCHLELEANYEFELETDFLTFFNPQIHLFKFKIEGDKFEKTLNDKYNTTELPPTFEEIYNMSSNSTFCLAKNNIQGVIGYEIYSYSEIESIEFILTEFDDDADYKSTNIIQSEQLQLKKGYNYIFARSKFDLTERQHICFDLRNVSLAVETSNEPESKDFKFENGKMLFLEQNFMVYFFKDYKVRKMSLDVQASVRITSKMNEFRIKFKSKNAILIELNYTKQKYELENEYVGCILRNISDLIDYQRVDYSEGETCFEKCSHLNEDQGTPYAIKQIPSTGTCACASSILVGNNYPSSTCHDNSLQLFDLRNDQFLSDLICPKLVKKDKEFTCFFEVSSNRSKLSTAFHYDKKFSIMVLDEHIEKYNVTKKATQLSKIRQDIEVRLSLDSINFAIKTYVMVYRDLHIELSVNDKLINRKGSKNEMLNLSFKISSWLRNFTRYTINYGDEATETGEFPLHDVKKNYKHGSSSHSEEKQPFLLKENISYLLTNTEFTDFAYLKYLEMDVSEAGPVNINIISFNFCGGHKNPCASYLNNNKMTKSNFLNKDYKILKSFQLDVKKGLNKFFFNKSEEFYFEKGSMVLIKDSIIGLNIEPSTSPLIHLVDLKKTIKIYPMDNALAQVSVTVLDRFFTHTIETKHSYASAGEFQVSINLHGISENSLDNKIQITEPITTTETSTESTTGTGIFTTTGTSIDTTTNSTDLLNSTDEQADVMRLVTYEGCFLKANSSLLNNSISNISPNNRSCFQFCRLSQFKFASFHNNSYCLCHDSIYSFIKDDKAMSCDDEFKSSHYVLYYKGSSLYEFETAVVSFNNENSFTDFLDKHSKISAYIFKLDNQQLDGCLTNCSNNGKCVYNRTDSKFGCKCFENFKGDECDIVRPERMCFMSPSPCKNNGTCITVGSSFSCNCTKLYSGKYCESKVKVCKGYNCSGNGHCIDKNDKPVCVCYTGYLGAKCNILSQKLKQIKATSNVSTIIALIMLMALGLGVISLDCITFWTKKKFLIFK